MLLMRCQFRLGNNFNSFFWFSQILPVLLVLLRYQRYLESGSVFLPEKISQNKKAIKNK